MGVSKFNKFSNFAYARVEQNEVGNVKISTELFFNIEVSGKNILRPNEFSSSPNWTSKVGKLGSCSKLSTMFLQDEIRKAP